MYVLIFLLFVGILSDAFEKNNKLPLLGLGVGNMQHDMIEESVYEAVQNFGITLIDTAAASHNEHLIRKALDRSTTKNIHILTKVWYTHLGYERTRLSVLDSLAQLGQNSIACVLIHWPRCNDNIPWMNCEEEETNLPLYVRQAGPAGTWQDSWRALEDLYDEKKIKNIGVSNFNFDEMKELISFARIQPHIFQGNVWNVFFDPWLMKFLSEKKIQFQAYNVLNGILPALAANVDDHNLYERSDNAYAAVKKIAHEVSLLLDTNSIYTPVQMILAWLIQKKIGVIPRSSSKIHLQENAQASQIKKISNKHMRIIGTYLEELLRAHNGLPSRQHDEL